MGRRAKYFLPVDLEVIVNHRVAHARHRAPWDGGVGVLQGFGQSRNRLADNLDIPDQVG